MSAKTFEDLFIDELRDMHDAEKRLVKALPKMAKAAHSLELRESIEAHLDQTRKHVERLEQVLEDVGSKPGRKPCEAMIGLLKEGEELLEESDDETFQDAAIILAAQKVEHYEMATYGTLRDWAKVLGHSRAANTLQQSLDEEGAADKKLTQLSGRLNPKGLQSSVHGQD